MLPVTNNIIREDREHHRKDTQSVISKESEGLGSKEE
jgi:hypothetical protein